MLFSGVFFYLKSGLPIVLRAIICTFVFVSISLYVMYFSADYFTDEGINNAVLYHVLKGLKGAGFSEYMELIVAASASLTFGLLLSGWLLFKVRPNPNAKKAFTYLTFICICISIIASPAISDLYRILYSPLTALSIHAGKSDFYKYYSQPKLQVTGKRKNLVIIYAESLERTYFDNTVFPGLIKGLRELEAAGITFTNVRQTDYAGWTMGGLVASQCGLPLITPVHDNDSIVGMDRYLPSATCLTDLLNDQGFHNVYYGGSNKVFAAKGTFLNTHNYHETHGEEDLHETLFDKSYLSGWGLYDDSVLDLSYKRFMELSENSGNFALINLTLDTHHPNGHASWRCRDIKYADGSNPILNAVACSDYLISEYVRKILDSPYASNTVIVIASDHLAMRNTATELLNQVDRRNMFIVLDPDSKPAKIEKLASTLDYGSTILPFVGFKANIGLGRNIREGGIESSVISYIQNSIKSWRPQIISFWDFPSLRDGITIDKKSRTMHISDRSFRVPALIKLTPELETNIVFRIYNNKLSSFLVDQVLELDEHTHFLLADSCKETFKLTGAHKAKGLCLVAGKGGHYRKVEELTGAKTVNGIITLSADDIISLTYIAK
jgi:phosphoglycerol transferase